MMLSAMKTDLRFQEGKDCRAAFGPSNCCPLIHMAGHDGCLNPRLTAADVSEHGQI